MQAAPVRYPPSVWLPDVTNVICRSSLPLSVVNTATAGRVRPWNTSRGRYTDTMTAQGKPSTVDNNHSNNNDTFIRVPDTVRQEKPPSWPSQRRRRTTRQFSIISTRGNLCPYRCSSDQQVQRNIRHC